MSTPRSSALVRAEHGGAPVVLDAAQKSLLADAVREGEALADELEDKVVAYGRYVLAKVFEDDTHEALDRRTKNPVWLELVRRAGGPSLRLSRHMLYVAVATAAWDKRVHDAAFRGLDLGRKELLLPLDDPQKLKAAANHVSKLSLTQTDTKQYVTSLLAEEGKKRQVRYSSQQLRGKARKLRQVFEDGATLRRVKTLRGEMDDAERARFVDEMDRLRAAVGEVLKVLRAK